MNKDHSNHLYAQNTNKDNRDGDHLNNKRCQFDMPAIRISMDKDAALKINDHASLSVNICHNQFPVLIIVVEPFMYHEL
jgi:hypothetical protein